MIDREARKQIADLRSIIDELQHFRTFEVALPLSKQETKGSGGSFLLTFDEALQGGDTNLNTGSTPIIPVRLVTGVLINGKYSANLLIRDPITETFSLGNFIWAIDVTDSPSPQTNTDYIVNPVLDVQGNLVQETGGNFIVALLDNTATPLSDTVYWAETTSDPATVAIWTAGTYPFGTIRQEHVRNERHARKFNRLAGNCRICLSGGIRWANSLLRWRLRPRNSVCVRDSDGIHWSILPSMHHALRWNSGMLDDSLFVDNCG